MTCSNRLGRDILCCRLSRRLLNERLFAGQTCSAGRGSGVANDGSSDKRTSMRWSEGLSLINSSRTQKSKTWYDSVLTCPMYNTSKLKIK
ncbi:Glutathione S-transferase omega-like 2 [Fusarium oxysporum f. sp. albedinis]|nr:Glutathione S-transferase omega-like 2 [Fusarium oxysporum f. sp. albedinis]